MQPVHAGKAVVGWTVGERWFRRIRTAVKTLVIVSLGLAAGACKQANQSSPEKEIFYGRFIFERDLNTVGGVDTDLVKFTIQDGQYSFVFSTFNSRVCNTKGTAYSFGTSGVNFVPDSLLNENCDSVHIPKGFYSSAFKGDSLYLLKYDTAASHRYRFDLKK
jgi:hypothetical protein